MNVIIGSLNHGWKLAIGDDDDDDDEDHVADPNVDKNKRKQAGETLGIVDFHR